MKPPDERKAIKCFEKVYHGARAREAFLFKKLLPVRVYVTVNLVKIPMARLGDYNLRGADADNISQLPTYFRALSGIKLHFVANLATKLFSDRR